MAECVWRDLGRMEYGAALEVQRDLVERRKRDEIVDQLLFVEHPHVITLGRNGKPEHLLGGDGIAFYETDRGGDITYHGPGQLVGYPILDLKQWKRDVVKYLRAIEEVLIGALDEFGLHGEREAGMTGVWVQGAKVAAIGVHISRWVTSHGFALNVTTDLRYFQHIVPCGLTRPVTSMERLLGADPGWDPVRDAVARQFGRVFEREMSEVEVLCQT